MKKEKLTEADKFIVAVDDLIEENQFENYDKMMLKKYNQAEAKRIAKEIDKEIMDLGEVYINIKVRKVDLPDDLVKFVNDGVKVVKELKKCREEIQELKGRIGKIEWNEFLNKMTVKELKDKVDKLEGDLEYAKCSGWLNRFVYPTEPFYPDYPIITYGNINTHIEGTIVINDIFKATT